MLCYAAVGEWCIEATCSGMGEEKYWLLNIYISIMVYHLHPLPEGILDPCFLRFRPFNLKIIIIRRNRQWVQCVPAPGIAQTALAIITWGQKQNCIFLLWFLWFLWFSCAYKQMLNISYSGSWDQNPVAVTVRRGNLVLLCLVVARSFGDSLLKILMVNIILSFICPHLSNFIMASEAPLQLGCPTLI